MSEPLDGEARGRPLPVRIDGAHASVVRGPDGAGRWYWRVRTSVCGRLVHVWAGWAGRPEVEQRVRESIAVPAARGRVYRAADDAHPTTDLFVYFIRLGPKGPIKIGKAKNPRARMADLQIGVPAPLGLLHAEPAPPERERELHARFAHLRIQGEWFKPAPDLLAYINERLVDFGMEPSVR